MERTLSHSNTQNVFVGKISVYACCNFCFVLADFLHIIQLSFTLTNGKSFTRAFQSQKDENWYVYQQVILQINLLLEMI